MKQIRFLMLMVALLCINISIFSQNSPFYTPLADVQLNSSSLKLTYPINNSVFQYSSSTNLAEVVFGGQVLVGTKYSEYALANKVYLRVQKYDYPTKTWSYIGSQKLVFDNCITCSSNWAEPKTFYLKGTSINTLGKGWYRVSLAMSVKEFCGTPIVYTNLSDWVNFGVDDVYYIAGQSNASGFTRLYDKSLAYYESTSPYPTNTDNNPPGHLIPDSKISEGSIVNRILTGNRSDTTYKVKGLPILANNAGNLGFQKFVSGKGGDKNEMGMAPNGRDSWAWARFADTLVSIKQYPVLLFNTAIPASVADQWVNTSNNLANTNKYFGSHLMPLLQTNVGALGAKAILWQQGEGESSAMAGFPPYNYPYVAPPNNYYQTLLSAGSNGLIFKSRDYLGNANLSWFISKTSYTTGAQNLNFPNDTRITKNQYYGAESSSGVSHKYGSSSNANNIITQQNNIINSGSNIYPGPNSDGIDSSKRTKHNGTHFDGYEGTLSGGKMVLGYWQKAGMMQ
jgi:hypothetical protein